MRCTGLLKGVPEGLFCRTCGAFVPVGTMLDLSGDWRGEHELGAFKAAKLPDSLRYHWEAFELEANYQLMLRRHGWADTPAKRANFAKAGVKVAW